MLTGSVPSPPIVHSDHPLLLARPLAITLLFLAACTASAQYHIDSWTTENGLPQNVIRDICRTPDGYLWLATMDGMVRFDGVRFVTFNRSNTPGIASNRFTSLYCAADGEFWAGTEFSGVTRYSQGKFTTYTDRQGLPSNEVPAVIGDDAGHIWVLSHTSIAQWNGTGFEATKVPAEDSKCNYFSAGRLGFSCIQNGNLDLFLRGQFLRYPLPRDWPGQTSRAGVDWSGAVWLASADCRFARLENGRWSEINRASDQQGAPSKWASQASTYRDSRGNLWKIHVGCDSGALLLQALDVPSRDQSRSIPFNALLEDPEGSIWLATDGQGLYRIRRQIITAFSIQDGLPDRNIYPIYQDRNGTIWIGTWNGGLAEFDGNRFTAVSKAAGLTSNRITTIFEDRDGVLWVGTAAGLFRRQRGRFQPVQIPTPGGAGEAHVIHEDPEGTLWVGTDHGLLRFQQNRWSLLTKKDGLATDDIRVIIDGRSGNLWIGGYGGLTSLDHGKMKRWTDADGLPSNSIRSLYEDRDGVLWIGTYDGGLGRLKDGRFTKYTVRDGLYNNGVFQILEDSHGYLWMSCNRGIYRVSKSQLNEVAAGKRTTFFSTVFGKSDGMRNAECNGGLWPAGIRARDGKMWFPTQDGVAVVDPDTVTSNPVPPPVVIESISVDRERQDLSRAIRVPPGSEDIEIEYTALSFLDSQHIRFRYKLEGLDRNWVEAETRRTAYYSHLPPGHYVFKVIAANSDGVWNMQGQSVAIFVLPPFYRTWWFLALAVMAGLGTVVLICRARQSQMLHERAAQQAFTRQLIASQESERKRIAAELHDGLGQQLVVIKTLALMSLDGGDPQDMSRSSMEEISTHASQALGEVKRISYNLRPYQLDRLGLTKAVSGLLQQSCSAAAIHCTTKIDPIDNVFAKDLEINFYRIVQECMNNLVKHSQATAASVVVRHTADEVLLTIRDNGKGFAPAAAGDGSEPEGFGLMGISERAQTLGGKLTIHSEPGQGTMITIRIPLSGGGDER